MDYNNVNKMGRIKEYNQGFGVGQIVAVDDVYIFTANDLEGEVQIGDIVKFRGEIKNHEKRAYFVDKVDMNYELKDKMIKSKVLNKE